eukprot:7135932-Ditylum_brightwellii.AAC.1
MEIQKGPRISTQGTFNLKDYKILSNNPRTPPWEQYFHTDYASPPPDKYQPIISIKTAIHWHNNAHPFNFKDYFGAQKHFKNDKALNHFSTDIQKLCSTASEYAKTSRMT